MIAIVCVAVHQCCEITMDVKMTNVIQIAYLIRTTVVRTLDTEHFPETES